MAKQDPREKMAFQLLMRGHASMDELLTASFGEWPPKGLDIYGKNIQSVRLTSLLDEKEGDENTSSFRRFFKKTWAALSTAGTGTLSHERIIRINHLLCAMLPGPLRESLNNTIGHEAAHILQGDHYYRAHNLFNKQDTNKIWTEQGDIKANMIAEPLFEGHMKQGSLRALFNKVAKYVYDDIDYQKQGIEIQARIHEVLMTGYPAWRRLPGNKVEFMTALADAGLRMPAAIKAELDAVPEIAEMRSRFSGARKSGPLPPGLSFMQSVLTEEGKVKLWRETMPALYADLIEMYGDRPGRARMGLGQNERAAYRERSLHFNPPRAEAPLGGASA